MNKSSRIILELDVCGKPAPGGSKTPGKRRGGSVFLRPASKFTKPWMRRVSEHARAVYHGPPVACSVRFDMEFRFSRPACHYGTGKNAAILKKSAPRKHKQDPDTTKLIRAVEDALNRIVWIDDNQVGEQSARKRWADYGEAPGVHIIVWDNDETEQGILPGLDGME